MHNFFVNKNQIKENTIEIIEKDVNHIKNVLRYKNGDKITVSINETRKKYLCEINQILENKIDCKIIEEILKEYESEIFINVVQGIPKSDKMELIIQKCTELGVSEFTPLELKRCVVKLNGNDRTKKVVRWQNIAEVAAKQSERNIIPKVNEIQTISTLTELLKEYDLIIIAYENENKENLKKQLEQFRGKKIAIIIGPEGGFEESEVELLKNIGGKSVSLGNRILRTETVALVLTGIIMYTLGDLGGKT